MAIEHNPTSSLILDAARGISAAAVLVVHIGQVLWLPVVGEGGVVHHIIGLTGRLAVLVFFLLSGYFITISILRNLHKNGGIFDWERYCSDRIIRIYPPLLLSVLIVVLLATAGIPKVTWSPQQIIGTLLIAQPFNGWSYLTSNSPLWSLVIEMWVYVLALFAGLLFSRNGTHAVIGAVFIVVILSFLHKLSLSRYYLFWLGVWATGGVAGAVHCYFSPSRKALSNIAIFGVFISCACLISYGFLAPNYLSVLSEILPGTENYWLSKGAQYAYAILSGAIIIMVCSSSRSTGRVVSALAETSAYSYTLYIVHFPLLQLCNFVLMGKLGMNFLAVSAISFLAIMLFAQKVALAVENTAYFKGRARDATRSIG